MSGPRAPHPLRHEPQRTPLKFEEPVTQDLPAWLQILADVLEATVIPVTIKRSTLRGTALIALDVMAPDVARTASATGKIRQPVADRAAPYRARKQDYQALCG